MHNYRLKLLTQDTENRSGVSVMLVYNHKLVNIVNLGECDGQESLQIASESQMRIFNVSGCHS